MFVILDHWGNCIHMFIIGRMGGEFGCLTWSKRIHLCVCDKHDGTFPCGCSYPPAHHPPISRLHSPSSPSLVLPLPVSLNHFPPPHLSSSPSPLFPLPSSPLFSPLSSPLFLPSPHPLDCARITRSLSAAGSRATGLCRLFHYRQHPGRQKVGHHLCLFTVRVP